MESKKRIFLVDWKGNFKLYGNLEEYFQVIKLRDCTPKSIRAGQLEELCDCLVIHPKIEDDLEAIKKMKNLGRPIFLVTTKDDYLGYSKVLKNYKTVIYCSYKDVLNKLKKIYSIK